MVNDFAINLVASGAFLALGFISRQLLSRFHTRATRRLWRGLGAGRELTIALSTRKNPLQRSGSTRTSFGDIRSLLILMPTLFQLRIPYIIAESMISTASQVTTNNILMIGGPSSNELAKEALTLWAPRLKVEQAVVDNKSSLTVLGKRYQSRYLPDGVVQQDYGLVVRTSNPFSSNPRLSATLVMGSHGIGTGGAARLLVDKHMIKQLLTLVPSDSFVAVVRVRPVGDEHVVKLEAAQAL